MVAQFYGVVAVLTLLATLGRLRVDDLRLEVGLEVLGDRQVLLLQRGVGVPTGLLRGDGLGDLLPLGRLHLLFEVHRDVHQASAHRDRHPGLVQALDQPVEVLLVAQVHRADPHVRQEELGLAHDALLAGLGVGLDDLLHDRHRTATIHLEVVVTLGLGDDLGTATHEALDSLLERRQELGEQVPVHGVSGVGLARAGPREHRLRHAERLEHPLLEALEVRVQVRHRLPTEHVLDLDGEVVGDEPEVGGERLVHVLGEGLEVGRGRHPRCVAGPCTQT